MTLKHILMLLLLLCAAAEACTRLTDGIKDLTSASELICQDSSGYYAEFRPMLGNAFGERLVFRGMVEKQTNALSGVVQYILCHERQGVKEKVHVLGDKALLEQNCNRKTWLVGYESISERWPFEQNWMYDMFFIPVRMQVAWGYERCFRLTEVPNIETSMQPQAKVCGASVIRPLLAKSFGEPVFATGLLCRRESQDENRYYIDFRFPRIGKHESEEIQVVFEFGDGGCYPPQPEPCFHYPKGRPKDVLKIDLDSLCGKNLSFVGIESIVQYGDPSWVNGNVESTNTGLIRRYTVVSLPNVIEYEDSDWYFIK